MSDPDRIPSADSTPSTDGDASPAGGDAGAPTGRGARRDDPSTEAAGDGDRDGDDAECPYCGSTDTRREHPKGPGLCRSMHFCEACGEPFERFG